MGVIPESEFGDRVRERLRNSETIWFTTTSANGTPQPNPVWFLWDEEDESVLIYNATRARRLEHVAVRPRVSLHFDSDEHADEVIVLAGVAEQAADVPPVTEHEAYLAKYRDDIARIGSDPEKFAQDYSVPLRIRPVKLRGF
jgi:PPOX class probable F420-dependent enzyme